MRIFDYRNKKYPLWWVNFYSRSGIYLSQAEAEALVAKAAPHYAYILEPAGVSVDVAWEMCKKRFKCWNPSRDLESEMSEADQGLSKEGSISAADSNLTLRKRLLFEAFRYDAVGLLSKPRQWTACLGSRYANGDIPGVRLFEGEFCVDWVHRKLE